MTKRTKTKKTKATTSTQARNYSLELVDFEPKTDAQLEMCNHWADGKNILALGYAGTGKTYVALGISLDEILNNSETVFKGVTIVRSAVTSRDVGYLPGSLIEKAKQFEAPYYGLCAQLFGRGDAYDILKRTGKISFITTSYERGTTIDNQIIVVDECQNMSFQELNTIITRVGQNSTIIFCGDFRQNDLHKSKYDVSGLEHFKNIIDNMPSFKVIEFGVDDIVRSGLVKEYILAKERYEQHADTTK